MLVDSWGAIKGEMDKEPGVLIAAINIGELERVRQRFPVLTQQRLDQKYR
ncbi:hypothetical protein MnTg04_00694 [bacterium MnTg04]|nr:hypothetical protein MnTg04_00694 [bacterium MnTg04]